jgi:DNA-binding LacI/PurR family transcriptional regulator
MTPSGSESIFLNRFRKRNIKHMPVKPQSTPVPLETRRTPDAPPEMARPENRFLETGTLETEQLGTGQLETGTLETGTLEIGQLEPRQLELGQFKTGQLVPGQLESGQLVPGQLESDPATLKIFEATDLHPRIAATPFHPSPAPITKRATLKDLATALGVAPSTVSNAYNRPDQLSKILRTRILETAGRMGYSGPHPVARGLRQQRLGAIGVLFGERLSYAFRDPAATMFLQGVALATEREGLGLTIVPAPLGEIHDPVGVRNAAVDGFVAYCLTRGPLIATVLERHLPLVLVDHRPGPGALHVNIRDEAGASEAARHLIGLGHRTIGILSLELSHPPQNAWVTHLDDLEESYFEATRARLTGYRHALERAGLGWQREYCVFESRGNTAEQGRRALREMMARTPRPTAILAMSDVLALGALEEARAMGLRVPEELSIVGFDDVPEAAQAGLTSVHQPHLEKGRIAAELLLARLRGETVESPARLETHLVVRQTSGVAP